MGMSDDVAMAARVHEAAQALNKALADAAEAGLVCRVEVIEVGVLSGPSHLQVAAQVLRPLWLLGGGGGSAASPSRNG